MVNDSVACSSQCEALVVGDGSDVECVQAPQHAVQGSSRVRCKVVVLALASAGSVIATVGAVGFWSTRALISRLEMQDGFVNLAEFQEPALYASTSKGLGTWYDPSKWGQGTCGYNEEWAPPGVAGTVAMNMDSLNAGGKMRSCGMCVQVWAKGDYAWNGHAGGGSLPMSWNGDIFFVTNACATCPGKGDMDFALKPGQGSNPGPAGNGIWDITWKGVPCPTESGKGAKYMLDSADNAHWVKARPMNLHYPVIRMEFQEAGSWKAGHLGDQFGFSWNPSSGPAESPLKVRLTTATGEVLLDQLPKLSKWVTGAKGVLDKSLAAR